MSSSTHKVRFSTKQKRGTHRRTWHRWWIISHSTSPWNISGYLCVKLALVKVCSSWADVQVMYWFWRYLFPPFMSSVLADYSLIISDLVILLSRWYKYTLIAEVFSTMLALEVVWRRRGPEAGGGHEDEAVQQQRGGGATSGRQRVPIRDGIEAATYELDLCRRVLD